MGILLLLVTLFDGEVDDTFKVDDRPLTGQNCPVVSTRTLSVQRDRPLPTSNQPAASSSKRDEDDDLAGEGNAS